MPRVLIAPMTIAKLKGPWVDLLLNAGFELVYPPKPVQLQEQELMSLLAGIDASLAGSEPYSARLMAANPQLKVIARSGVGYDAVDVKAATEHGIVVTYAPNTNQEAVAEHAFALMLGLVKDVVPQHLAVKAGTWPRRSNLPLRGRTLGIAGLGRIGKAVALRAAAFGMPLLAYDPYPDTAFATRQGIPLVSFDLLLRESDIITLHLPLTAESKQMINAETLAKMKPTAFLINTARGGLVNEADLAEALRAHKIAGAGLDVLDQEPPAKSNPLFQLDNILFTPHTAGIDTQSRDDMALAAAKAIIALFKGEWPTEWVVNPEVRPQLKAASSP